MRKLALILACASAVAVVSCNEEVDWTECLKEGETVCQNNAVVSCTNGTWKVVEACGDRLCNADKLACEAKTAGLMTCNAYNGTTLNHNGSMCDGTQVIQCVVASDATQSPDVTVSDCANNTDGKILCHVEDDVASCYAPDCTAGQTKCEDSKTYQCENYTWVENETCENGCGEDDQCASACTAGDTKCDDNKLFTCVDQDGKPAWNEGVDCANYVCKNTAAEEAKAVYACVDDAACDSAQHLVDDGNGGCVCADGYVSDDNGGCKAETSDFTCTDNESYCQEKDGHMWRVTCMNGAVLESDAEDSTVDCTAQNLLCTEDSWGAYCAVCTTDDVSRCTESIPDNAKTICDESGYTPACGWECNEGWTLNDAKDGCVGEIQPACAAGWIYDANTNTCVCDSANHYKDDNGTCTLVTCSENQTFGTDGISCVCAEGYDTDADGNCVKKQQPECTAENQKYDETTNTCVCVDNYVLMNGTCVAKADCSAEGLKYDENTNACVCNVEDEIVCNSQNNGTILCVDGVVETEACSGTTPYCNNGECVECLNDEACDADMPFCSNGTCVECKADSDCGDTYAYTCSAGLCEAKDCPTEGIKTWCGSSDTKTGKANTIYSCNNGKIEANYCDTGCAANSDKCSGDDVCDASYKPWCNDKGQRVHCESLTEDDVTIYVLSASQCENGCNNGECVADSQDPQVTTCTVDNNTYNNGDLFLSGDTVKQCDNGTVNDATPQYSLSLADIKNDFTTVTDNSVTYGSKYNSKDGKVVMAGNNSNKALYMKAESYININNLSNVQYVSISYKSNGSSGSFDLSYVDSSDKKTLLQTISDVKTDEQTNTYSITASDVTALRIDNAQPTGKKAIIISNINVF